MVNKLILSMSAVAIITSQTTAAENQKTLTDITNDLEKVVKELKNYNPSAVSIKSGSVAQSQSTTIEKGYFEKRVGICKKIITDISNSIAQKFNEEIHRARIEKNKNKNNNQTSFTIGGEPLTDQEIKRNGILKVLANANNTLEYYRNEVPSSDTLELFMEGLAKELSDSLKGETFNFEWNPLEMYRKHLKRDSIVFICPAVDEMKYWSSGQPINYHGRPSGISTWISGADSVLGEGKDWDGDFSTNDGKRPEFTKNEASQVYVHPEKKNTWKLMCAYTTKNGSGNQISTLNITPEDGFKECTTLTTTSVICYKN